MKNQKEIEEKIADIVCWEVCCAGQSGVSDQTKQIKDLIQSEKKKWKAEMMDLLKHEELEPYEEWIKATKPYGGTRKEYEKIEDIINNYNNLRQQLRDRLEKI